MNKNLLFLSIIACFSSLPSYANNIENDLNTNVSNNTFSEADYKKKLEEFLMDEEPDEAVSEEKKSENLTIPEDSEVDEISVVNIKEETKESQNPKVSQVEQSSVVADDGLNVIRMSSLESKISNLSLLLESKINSLSETNQSHHEELNTLKNEVSEKFDNLGENISSKVGQKSIKELDEKLSELRTYVDDAFSNFYSKEVVDEKVSQLKSNLENLATEVKEISSIIEVVVKDSEYESYKKTIEEKFKTLKEDLVAKSELNENLMSLKNKVEGNSLSLKEKSDVIKDVKKNIGESVERVVRQVQNQEQIFDERLSALENDTTKKQGSEDMKQLLDEKDAVIEEQNKKIEELDKKYNALFKQVAELKESGFNNNIIKVESLTNLKEAEKKVQEDGGVLILDKNGQLKVLN